MKSFLIAPALFLIFITTVIPPVMGQYNTVKYVSHGYFKDMNFADSLMIKADMVISISQNKVEILKIDMEDASKDTMFFESRCLSALKYPTADGDTYYVWKLGDRKMILRKIGDNRYLSLYQTDEYGLPKDYMTFKLKD